MVEWTFKGKSPTTTITTSASTKSSAYGNPPPHSRARNPSSQRQLKPSRGESVSLRSIHNVSQCDRSMSSRWRTIEGASKIRSVLNPASPGIPSCEASHGDQKAVRMCQFSLRLQLSGFIKELGLGLFGLLVYAILVIIQDDDLPTGRLTGRNTRMG